MPVPKDKYTGCLIVGLLCFAFIVGGMLGGIFGGWLILWATAPTPLAQQPTAISTATATPQPTLLPTATPPITPTPTRVVEPTPSTADIVEAVLPAVVTVINHQDENAGVDAADDKRVIGSGIVISSQGYIVTNAHVVSAAKQITVILSGGEERPAELVTEDVRQDLALLKIEADNLIAGTWGNSNAVRLGQPVIAIGSALGDFPNSVTMGIVSGLDRALALNEIVVYGLIQTDAAINQGNSGGPLVNMNGEIIGINTFIIREDHEQGVAQGIGFAIPAGSAQLLASAWIAQDDPTLQASDAPPTDSSAPVPLPASQPAGGE